MTNTQTNPKTIYVQGHPVKIKYSAASNHNALQNIQSIILGEAADLQLFADSDDLSDNGRIAAEETG